MGNNCEYKMARQMVGRRSLKDTPPACTQSFEIEIAQVRDLVLCRSGRGTTIATFLLHRIRPPVWRGPLLQEKLCHL